MRIPPSCQILRQRVSMKITANGVCHISSLTAQICLICHPSLSSLARQHLARGLRNHCRRQWSLQRFSCIFAQQRGKVDSRVQGPCARREIVVSATGSTGQIQSTSLAEAAADLDRELVSPYSTTADLCRSCAEFCKKPLQIQS